MANEQEDLVLHDDPNSTRETQEHIQRLENENRQMKVILEGYQRPLHAEETDNHQLGEIAEKENNVNSNHPGNRIRCMHEELGGKENPAVLEASTHLQDQQRRTRDEVEEITEAEALRTAPRKRTTEPMITGSPSMANKEIEELQEMMWNKLLALEAKSWMGVHSEWARMEGSTLSPFENHILRVEAPQRYTAPKLPEYNGTGDPSEYDLILRFQTNFAISVQTEKVDTDLMLIHQRTDEPLERFINRFSEEYVSIPKRTDSVATKALMQGLMHGSELKKAIIVELGLSLTRALTMARGYVALELEEKRHVEEVSRETSVMGDTFLFETKDRMPAARPHNRNEGRPANKRNARGTVMKNMGQTRQLNAPRSEEELPRMTITLTELMRRLRGMKETKWPAKMTTDPDKRDKSQYYAFHGEHGHDTYECRQLKIKVNRLVVVNEGFDEHHREFNAWMELNNRETRARKVEVDCLGPRWADLNYRG
uniref:Retrotransposon gag domain-containing protein n=1 Tax=Cannabis sativa TaxID=3483 RepID=A0A803NN09_CANSA